MSSDGTGADVLEFQPGKPVRRSFGRFTVSVDPVWTDQGTREHLVTVFAGYPAPAWVRRMSWQLLPPGGGSRTPPATEYRPDARGQFRLRIGDAPHLATCRLRLRPAAEVRRERLAVCLQAGRQEDAVGLLREVLDELASDRAALAEDAPPRQVVDALLDRFPGPAWHERRTEEQRFLLEAAGVAWLDFLADAARTGARRSAPPGGEVRPWTLQAARSDPDGLLARAGAWEELAERDAPAARRHTLAELAGRTAAEVDGLLAAGPPGPRSGEAPHLRLLRTGDEAACAHGGLVFSLAAATTGSFQEFVSDDGGLGACLRAEEGGGALVLEVEAAPATTPDRLAWFRIEGEDSLSLVEGMVGLALDEGKHYGRLSLGRLAPGLTAAGGARWRLTVAPLALAGLRAGDREALERSLAATDEPGSRAALEHALRYLPGGGP
jgi:hypothetical protein